MGESGGAGTSWGGRLTRVLAGVVPTGVFVWQVVRLRQWLVDDALISMAYARTLAQTGRWAQTVTDPQVEGVSNPAWTLLLAGLRRVGVFDAGGSFAGLADYLVTFRVLTVVAFIAVHLLLARAVVKVSPRAGQLVSAAAMLLLATSTPFVVWMASGLENPLYAVVVAALAAGLVRWQASDRLLAPAAALWAGLLVFAAAVTRPDGLVFAAAYPLAVLLTLRRGEVGRAATAVGVHVGVCLVSLGAFFGWRYATFHAWVPNTAVAKGQGLDPLGSAQRVPELAGALSWTWLALLVVATLAVLILRGATRRTVLTAGVPVALSALAYLILEPDWMGEYRFATPLLVSAAVLTAVVAGSWLAPRPRPAGRWAHTLVAVGLAAALVGANVEMVPRLGTFIPGPTVGDCRIVERYGRLFNFYADELGLGRETVALPDIGGTLLVSRLRVLDLAGLTEPQIARFLGSGDAAGLTDYVFDAQRPALMNLHGSWTVALRKDARLRRDYVALASEGDWVRRDIAEATPNFTAISKAGGELVKRVEKRYQAQLNEGCGALTVGESLRP